MVYIILAEQRGNQKNDGAESYQNYKGNPDYPKNLLRLEFHADIMIAKIKKTKKEGKFQDVFFSLFLVIFFFGSIGFLIVSNYRINQKRSEMLSKIESLKEEIGTLEEQNEDLQAGISHATSVSFQEEKIREQGYQKPGEQNVVVLPPENKTVTSTEKSKNLLEKLLEKIGF